jgi:hypothetical protein
MISSLDHRSFFDLVCDASHTIMNSQTNDIKIGSVTLSRKGVYILGFVAFILFIMISGAVNQK